MRLFVTTAVLAMAVPGLTAAVDDVGAVKATFKAYQTALVRRDGAGAAALVDRGTVDYYQRMRNLAVAGPAMQVKRLALLDKLMVLRMRHQIPLAKLKAMDGKAALAFGVTQGSIGSDVAKMEAGAVEIAGERATIVFVVDGQPTPVKLGMWRENGGWRVDLISLARIAGAAFRQRQQESGKSEDEFVRALVGQLAGKPARATIWNPPK